MEIPATNASAFEQDVLKASLPVLVDFTAAWCGPCKMIAPIIEELAQEWSGKVKIYKLDVDESPEIPMRYQVMSIPTLILFRAGEPVQRVAGYQPKNRLIAQLLPHFG